MFNLFFSLLFQLALAARFSSLLFSLLLQLTQPANRLNKTLVLPFSATLMTRPSGWLKV